MADKVIWQTEDDLSQTNLAESTAQSNNTNYVERGLSFNPDHGAETLDTTAGYAIISDGMTAYHVYPDARSGLALPETNGINYVFLTISPGSQDSISVDVETTDSAPSAHSVKIGEVNTADDTHDDTINREPAVSVRELVDGAGVSHTGELADASDLHARYTDEEAQDAINALLSMGDKLSKSYDDGGNTLTLDTSALDAEEVRDEVGTLLAAGDDITVTVDDAGDTVTIALSDSITVSSLGGGVASTAITDFEGDNLSVDGSGVLNASGGTSDGETFASFNHVHSFSPAPSKLHGTWAKSSSNPVLTPSGSGWDSQNVLRPTFIKDDDGTYVMIYEGYDGSTEQLGLATSTDLVNWTKDSNNPVVVPNSGDWEEGAIYSPYLLKIDGTYHLYYAGGGKDGSTGSIGHATSTDLVNWTRDANNPLITPNESGFGDKNLSEPTVFVYGDIAYMLFAGGSTSGPIEAGWAYSKDLSNWTKDPNNPVFGPGTSGEWDEVDIRPTGTCVVDGMLYTLYEGVNSSDNKDVGLIQTPLSSPIQFEKSAYNPQLQRGASGEWDDGRVYDADVIREGNRYQVMYTGDTEAGSSGTRSIGYAYIDVGV